MAVVSCPHCGKDDMIKTSTARKTRKGVVWMTLTYLCNACAKTCWLNYYLVDDSDDGD